MNEELLEQIIFDTSTFPRPVGDVAYVLIRHAKGTFEEYIADSVEEVLDCAFESGAKYIVTPDRQLLKTKDSSGITIITPQLFRMLVK
jgi:predicted nucleic acid-binding protein